MMYRVLKTCVLLSFSTTTLLSFVVSSEKCAAKPNMLTFSCDENCPERPCLVYEPKIQCNATSFSTCEGNPSACQYECFKLSPDDFYKNSLTQRSNVTFLVPFGQWKSKKEEWDENENEKNKIALTDDTSDFPSKSNNILKKFDVLAIPKSTKRLTLAGGTSIIGNRGQVANVEIPPEFLFEETQLESVTLANLNIGQIPVSSFPSDLEALTMSNCLLTLFPDDVGSMSKLSSLDLSKNYLQAYPVKYSKDSLTFINMSGNNMDTFDALLPNVEVLDLTENLLTNVPSTIFKMDKLKQLSLQGNSFTNVELTSSQFEFLKQLDKISVDNFGEPSCDTQKQQKLNENVSVCVGAGFSGSGSSSRNNRDGMSMTWIAVIIVGSVLVVVIMIATFCIMRKRKATDGKMTTDTLQISSNFHSGTGNGTREGSTSTTAQSIWQDQQLLSLQVNINEIEDIKKIGNGAYGVVWLARYRRNQFVASKRLKADDVNWKNTQMFIEEIKLVAQFDHPRIVGLVGVAWTIESNLQALFEYMEKGDLRTHLDHNTLSKYWSRDKIQIAIDIAEALVYLHSFQPPLVHRDLKSRNILLSNDMRAKVSDFGVSRFRSENNTMTSGIGTGRWLAPEVIAGVKDYDQAVDIFSYGVVLSELDTHQVPYSDIKGTNDVPLPAVAILQMVAAGQLKPSFSTTCPPGVLEIARKCLMYDRKERPTAVEVAFMLRSYQKQVVVQEGDYSFYR